MTRIAAFLLASLGAACGGLGTPDLATGEVRGRIAGGTAGGYVYPVGRPDLLARLAADGSFRVKVPAGGAELVLYDGQPVPVSAPYGRAGRLAVEVEGAEIADVGVQDGLPVAGAILAGVRAESGAGCRDPRFQVELLRSGVPAATDQDRTGAGASALLTPLPPGPYQLRVSMAGFRPGLQAVDLAEAQTVPVELVLGVDDDEDERGCEVTGCDSSELECCDDGDDCEDEGRCFVAGGSAGSCGSACDESGGVPCQAGLACVDATCQPPGGPGDCSTYLATVGATCLSDAACSPARTGLACQGRSDDHAGYCTASCQVDAECAAFPLGWTCDGEHDACRPPHE